MTLRTALGGMLALTATLPVGAGERITMRVSPVMAFAPAFVIVNATIVANAENRAVEVVAESRDFYRSSEIQLEGDMAPRTSTVEFRSLPPGVYEVRANLLGANRHALATTRQRVNVYATGASGR